ncbi:MAG: hypothetical protein PHP28_05665 [Actinomycetota bacterium]|nr:hypothetical protein [Actinomycetota bacterium]MDD5667054.1 hypothetical protein [Actinomycetota bacterium]
MPVIKDISIEIGMEEVLRREGIDAGKDMRPRIKEALDEALEEAGSSGLIEPVAAYESYRSTGMSEAGVRLEGGGEITGSLIPEVFPGADGLVAMVCTIGQGLEDRVREHFENGEQMRGLMLDGIGSAAVDVLSIEACHRVMQSLSARGAAVSSPVNPGMPGLPLTEQAHILELARAGEIGVSLTSGGMLVPRKSASMVIGVGENMPRWTQEQVCAKCFLRKNCLYRVRPATRG